VIVQSTFFLLSLAAILILINIVCPNPHRRLKGLQRIQRIGLPSIPWLADEAPGALFATLLAFLTILTYTTLHLLAVSSESILSISSSPSSILFPASFLLFCTLSLRAAREQWFNLGFWGFLGLLWLTPILACLVLAINDFLGNSQLMLYVSSLSPVTFIPQLLIHHSPHLIDEANPLVDLSASIQFGMAASFVCFILLTYNLWKSSSK